MSRALHLIDAFSSGPFTGNPAAVVLLDHAEPDAWMQSVATEMNQAETAFLIRQHGDFSLRWFTPAAEVDLCGHATLASAHYLWEGKHLAGDAVARFHTRSGLLTATRADSGWITLDLPALDATPMSVPAGLIDALGVTPKQVLQSTYDIICILQSEAEVISLAPNLTQLARLNARGVLVSAAADTPGHDIVSRCFFPALGVPEDPVTGSAHCALIPYWHNVLGRGELVARQASARGGTLRCVYEGDRVLLSGQAVTTLRGTLLA